jgi:dynactin complex subunit
MWYTILFSILIIVIMHAGYTHLRDYLTTPKTKDVYEFNNNKVNELIELLESNKKEETVDFSSMEGELADLIHNESDIETSGDTYLDVDLASASV